MTSSSPADLAVTFRSIPRRLREAYGDDQPASGSDLAAQLGAAARLLGTAAEPDSIAAAIDARKPGEWDGPTLDDLRQISLDVGAELRRIVAEHEDRDRDG
ncbi:MAG: hypothetical protein QM733_19000 [Ilumatobacteraceae bacterium]